MAITIQIRMAITIQIRISRVIPVRMEITIQIIQIGMAITIQIRIAITIHIRMPIILLHMYINLFNRALRTHIVGPLPLSSVMLILVQHGCRMIMNTTMINMFISRLKMTMALSARVSWFYMAPFVLLHQLLIYNI